MEDPTFHAEIEIEHIRALSHLAPTQGVRHYLNGVFVCAAPQVSLVATTGDVLGLIQTEGAAPFPFEVLIPNETLKALGKAKGRAVLHSLDGKHWTLATGPLALTWAAEPIVYPDFRRAIPATTSGIAAQIDARQVLAFWKAAKEIGADKKGQHSVLISQNGANAALVSLPLAPNFTGVISPLKEEGVKFPAPQPDAPSWAKSTPYVPANWRTAPACDLA